MLGGLTFGGLRTEQRLSILLLASSHIPYTSSSTQGSKTLVSLAIRACELILNIEFKPEGMKRLHERHRKLSPDPSDVLAILLTFKFSITITER